MKTEFPDHFDKIEYIADQKRFVGWWNGRFFTIEELAMFREMCHAYAKECPAEFAKLASEVLNFTDTKAKKNPTTALLEAYELVLSAQRIDASYDMDSDTVTFSGNTRGWTVSAKTLQDHPVNTITLACQYCRNAVDDTKDIVCPNIIFTTWQGENADLPKLPNEPAPPPPRTPAGTDLENLRHTEPNQNEDGTIGDTGRFL